MDFFKEIEKETDNWKVKLFKPETREQMIARWELEGRLDPNCPGCREFYESPGLPSDVFAPGHKASGGCESGKRAHCTCSSCWD